jgi:hypothetical protein
VVKSSESFCVLYGVFIAEEVVGVGDKGSGDTTVVVGLLNMSLRLAVSLIKLSYGKKKNFWSYYSSQVLDYQDF